MRPLQTLLTRGVLVSCIVALHIPPAFSKDAWAVARSPKAFPGSCYVGEQPFAKTTSDQYSQILASKLASRKVACQKAKDLKTDEVDDDKGCFAYSTASIVDCKNEGVELK
ncbi:hypothetical protein [Mesorhizobium sp. B2-6-2]|uniref:hypothetical protein n=1 Tax=Mesorhizobium sp. B2-6-2 TaxID=2589915 RepID=UPI00112CC65B|nr:hypothetical protein [Mesorhizobium sp. B2-6-2]TPJ77214.1 hypothetical protein FJ419_17030 [Mesorhizobium sp. B2-6-2]